MMRIAGWMAVLAAMATAAWSQQSSVVHFTIDARQNVKPISRYIYGVNQPLEGAYANLPFTRVGGNRWTAYNWTNNASNAGNDWQFQNDSYLGGGDKPAGAVCPRIENAASRGAGILLTIPMCDYVAADKKGGGDVRKSGPDYLATRFCRNQPKKGAAFTLTPRGPVVYQDEFVNWIQTTYPSCRTDAKVPIWFSLDNEPDLWSHTHAEIHPQPITYAEIVRKTIDFAGAIKAVAPKALIFGPVNYGWGGFTNLQHAPDGNKRDFLEYFLAQMKEAETAAGKRLLDVLDVHWYPEARGGNVRITAPDAKDEVAAARMQAPRSLWDTQYMETSWITKDVLRKPIGLIPRLMEKVDRCYPGTKLAITEYNYGGGEHISGAIAQADVLGIFGREGVFAACQWPLAKKEPFIAGAFQMFRDFDGQKGTFGDTSILARTDHVADTSIYASLDSASSSRMVVVAINKTAVPLKAMVHIDHAGRYTAVEVYQLTRQAASPRKADAIRLAAAGDFEYTLPALSISTLVLN